MFPSLTRSIHSRVPSDRRLYCSSTPWAYGNAIWTRLHRCTHLYNGFTTFLAVFPVFPRLDHSNHSQLRFTRSQYCWSTLGASNSKVPGRSSRGTLGYNEFRVFGSFSVFPYKSCSIPRQRALTHRLYDRGRRSARLWRALHRYHQ